MRTVVANLSGKVRRERRNGRSYLVAPATILVSGVLNGSDGPVYYPPDEVERDPDEWNGTFIVVNHPTKDGKFVSARDPEILDKYGIGNLYRTLAANGKSSTEAWFDEDDTRRVDPRILLALENGTPLELSTGLFASLEPAPEGAVYNGISYKFIARNYRADHLAVLPDHKGACAITDGCGILVNADKKTLWQKLGELLGIAQQSQSGANGIGTSSEPPEKIPGGNNTGVDPPAPVVNGGDAVNKAQLVDWLVTNCDCWKHAGDKEVLNGMSEQKLLALKDGAEKAKRAEEVAEAARKGFESGSERHVFNQATGRWDSSPKPPPAPVAPTGNESRLTPEEREDLEFARQERTRQKEQLIGQLIANVREEPDRKAKADWLRTQSMQTLQQMVGLLPPQAADQSGYGSGLPPLYTGAASPTSNAGRSQDDEAEVLSVPVMNWKAMEAERNSGEARRVQ